MDGIRHGAAAPPMIRCGAAAPHEVRGGRVVAGSIAARGGRVEAESATVAGQVALRFTGGPHFGSHANLTAVHADGAHLWVAGDETATIERLVLDAATAPTRAGRQRSFRLADLVQLPGPANGEADIEGIARAGGWLWAIGSHALVRRRPKPMHDEEKVVRRLGKLRRDPNRYVIVRLAVQLGVDRSPEPVRVSRDGRRSALVGAPGAENLLDLLRADTHLAPFLAIPARDNGIDVQGLAVVGDRLYVGLRGPVLRGWAVVLEVRPVQDPTDPGRLALGIFPEGARYRKHFLELGGLGVRDLCLDGDDLLVLAGPTMALSGPVRVHRWRGAAPAGPVVREAQLPVETVVPHGEGPTTRRGSRCSPATRAIRGRGCWWSTTCRPPARRPWPTRACSPTGCGSGTAGVADDGAEEAAAEGPAGAEAPSPRAPDDDAVPRTPPPRTGSPRRIPRTTRPSTDDTGTDDTVPGDRTVRRADPATIWPTAGTRRRHRPRQPDPDHSRRDHLISAAVRTEVPATESPPRGPRGRRPPRPSARGEHRRPGRTRAGEPGPRSYVAVSDPLEEPPVPHPRPAARHDAVLYALRRADRLPHR